MERKFADLKYIEPDAKVVILGTFPSEASRDTFFYHKSTNQFWKIMSKIFGDNSIKHLETKKNDQKPTPNENNQLIENRKNFLKKHKIGLWDMIKSCYIDKSKDSSIKDPEYNNLTTLKTECPQLECICFSSKKAFKYYKRYLKQVDETYKNWLEKMSNGEEHILPSPSSAYARMGSKDKRKKWQKLLTQYVKK
ncbi:MAG: DNA-deoxyinosine glycosylase [Alphaproteobacteria bacterium]|nr:DNA-deoxyinosine glycosylase [Alphaproteobacteria bacterium]